MSTRRRPFMKLARQPPLPVKQPPAHYVVQPPTSVSDLVAARNVLRAAYVVATAVATEVGEGDTLVDAYFAFGTRPPTPNMPLSLTCVHFASQT